jgi:hypothetical protein
MQDEPPRPVGTEASQMMITPEKPAASEGVSLRQKV